MSTQKKCILLLPAYNEKGKIGNVITKVPKGIVEEIIVIDDGSTDGTKEEAEKAGAKVIRHETNKGVGAGLRTGIEYAISNGYDVVVIMAGDDQDIPDEMPIVLKPILEDDYDFVQGSRRLHGRRTIDMPFFRRITTRIYSIVFRLFTGFKCTDGTNGFRAFQTRILKDTRINLNQEWLNTYELEPYLFYKAVTLGYKVCEAPVTKKYHKGVISYSKMIPFKDWWRILRPIVFLRFGIKR